jgi:hypothetical protein
VHQLTSQLKEAMLMDFRKLLFHNRARLYFIRGANLQPWIKDLFQLLQKLVEETVVKDQDQCQLQLERNQLIVMKKEGEV